jgi:hypothetical protein
MLALFQWRNKGKYPKEMSACLYERDTAIIFAFFILSFVLQLKLVSHSGVQERLTQL